MIATVGTSLRSLAPEDTASDCAVDQVTFARGAVVAVAARAAVALLSHSSMPGAYESGQAAAQKVLKALK